MPGTPTAHAPVRLRRYTVDPRNTDFSSMSLGITPVESSNRSIPSSRTDSPSANDPKPGKGIGKTVVEIVPPNHVLQLCEQELLNQLHERIGMSSVSVVRRWPLATDVPIRVRVRARFRIIRSTWRNTCHLACTRDAVDARCHVSAASLAVSETAGAEACIIGGMISDLGG